MNIKKIFIKNIFINSSSEELQPHQKINQKDKSKDKLKDKNNKEIEI